MAGENSIGKLTIDISDVGRKVEEVNKALSRIGSKANINISKQVAKEVKSQLDSVLKEIDKYSDEIRKSAESVSKSLEGMGAKGAKNKELTETINNLKEYYTLLKQAETARQQGNKQNEELYTNAANDALSKVNEGLREQAEAYKTVIKAKRELEAAQNKTSQKEAEAEAREVEKATQAYIKMLEAKSKVKQLESEGKQGTEEYLKATQAAGKATDAYLRYSQGVREAAKASKEAAQARKDLNAVEQKVAEDSSQVDYLSVMKQKYFELTDAIKRYNAEKEAKNELGMATEQAKIDATMQEVYNIQQAVEASNIEAETKQRVLNIIQQCVTAETQHTTAINSSISSTSELESQMTGLLTRMFSIMAVIRAINSLISNTVEYVTEYSDKMNEIQIITQKSSAEVEQLSKTYMNIAEEMNVSSLNIADAAIYFTRQGLPAEEIENRLKNITMYAKTANVEFKESSEIITAVVNSMGLVEQEAEDGRNATERVADVFLKVGDNAATSGEEIGRAMQKAAASAGAFGVSFEWLSSAIATVSETTRQEARTIGTAFNTIIARLHQIKQTGYNQEDETKINDVAKALSKIDIALMDQSGNWRDMEDIWNEIAEKWDDLDGKTKSYIATTMAGVKQQNVFLAAMNDMSKSVEEGGRFWELYALAMDSAGTAEEKYSIWTDSVAASQERLTLAQEKFYSLLDSDVIKNWNDMLAGLVTQITRGAEAWGAWPAILSAVSAGIVGVITYMKLAAAAASQITTIFTKHPMVMAVAAAVATLATLVTVISGIADATAVSKRRFEEATEAIEKSEKKISKAESVQSSLAEMYKETEGSVKLSAEQLVKYNSLLDDLASISPQARDTVDQLRDGMISQKDAVEQLNAEIESYIENERIIEGFNLMKKLNNIQGDQTQNTKFANVASTWDKSMYAGKTGLEGFTNALKSAYSKTIWFDSTQDTLQLIKGEATVIGNYLTQEIYDSIKDSLDQGISWEQIARSIYGEMFPGDLTYDVGSVIRDQINSMIDETMAWLGDKADSLETDIIRQKLFDDIWNSNMSVEDAAGYLSRFIGQVLESGVTLEPDERLIYLGRQIFGNYFDALFGEEALALVDYDPDAVDFIEDAVRELFEAGFDVKDIQDMLRNMPMLDWETAADIVRDQLKEKLRNVFNAEFLGNMVQELIEDEYGNITEGDIEQDELLWEQLDIKTLQEILSIAEQGGITLDEVNSIMEESNGDIGVFIEKLHELTQETEGDTTENIENFAEAIKTLTTEINDYNKVIEALEKGETVDFSDLLDLSNAHPEILEAIGDTKALIAVLNELKAAKGNELIENLRGTLYSNADFAQTTPFEVDQGETLLDYMKKNADVSDVEAYVDEIIVAFLAQSGRLEDVGKDVIANWMTSMFSDANFDMLDRKVLEFGDHIETIMSETYTASTDGSHGLKWNQDIVMNFTPITPDGKKLTTEELDNYVSELLSKSADLDELKRNDMKENGGLGLFISADVDFASFEEGEERAESLMTLLHLLQQAYYDVIQANEDWLETLVKQQEQEAENEWAKSNGFVEQITKIQDALDNGGIEEAIGIWNNYDETMQKSIADTYPQLARAILDARKAIDDTESSEEDLTKATNNLNRELNQSKKYATAKYFKGTYDAIQKLEKGTITATDAYEAFNKELDKVKKASEEVEKAEDKLAEGTELTTSDVNDLASVLGMSAEQIIADWPNAVAVFDALISSTGDMQAALDALNNAAFIRITGTSEADFSAISAGLISVRNLAEEAVKELLATGQWKLETLDTPQTAAVWHPGTSEEGGGYWSYETETGTASYLVPTGNNPFSGGGGGGGSKNKDKGGGGGGGGGKKDQSKNQKTKVERMLDRMSQRNNIQDYQRSFYQANQKYYEQTGQLQGVIAYMEREEKAITKQNKTLESNIRKIEKKMEAKRKELAQLKETDEKYDEVANDLKLLQEAHQDYTNELIDNRTELEKLKDSIKELNDQIRDMEIDIENEILQAILDREKKKEESLEAEVQMQNKILDIIKQRYEKERDQIIETTNLKIESLERERDLLSEQLELRKKQADQEDKQKKLIELEQQYQRIMADPTRAKEAEKIRKEISELREEMAWDAAEEEVKAQQDSIDQQIGSLEDYIESIENYYEDLFEHPTKLIAEMEQIMAMTDEKIIEWLEQNDEEYRTATDERREQIRKGWSDTLDTMRGKIKTYWVEVQQIISQGDDAIIKFLKDNSSKYAEASKLQAEKFVDEWKKKLEDLKKAHEKVAADIAASYDIIEDSSSKAKDKSDSKSGGGGGGGGSSSGEKYKFTYNGKEYKSYSSKSAAETAINKLAKAERDQAARDYPNGGTQYDYYYGLANTHAANAKKSIKAYAKGGLANYTGPAWIDGSQTNPERILSPYQTKLFESMIDALERMSRISVPTMPNFGDLDLEGSGGVSVGDIIVNVDNLDTDDDYETLAKKVSDILMERIGRTTVVGGLRINS